MRWLSDASPRHQLKLLSENAARRLSFDVLVPRVQDPSQPSTKNRNPILIFLHLSMEYVVRGGGWDPSQVSLLNGEISRLRLEMRAYRALRGRSPPELETSRRI